MHKISKAVFPVAGQGTRFLPATKANPKEMLPIVDKPLIQYAAEEAVAAGITELVFITGRAKRAITDHFDKAYELEAELAKKGETEKLAMIRDIVPAEVSCIYIRQAEPLGLGHAVLCARPVVGDAPFAVLLPDDLIDDGERGVTRQLAAEYEKTGHSVIAAQNVPRADTGKYGVVAARETAQKGRFRLSDIVEKPAPEAAPSTLGVVGRYVLTPEIFGCLAETPRGAGDEIQLTDAIRLLLGREPVYALEFEGVRYDCGARLGYMQAQIQYALKDETLKEALRDYIGGLRLD